MAPQDPTGQEWHADVLERLLSLKREGESDAAFARRIGLQPQHLSNYRSGRHGLSLRTAVRIANNTGISLDWLLRGEGGPFGGEGDAAQDETASPVVELRRYSSAVRRSLEELRRGGAIAEEHVEQFESSLETVLEPLTT